MQHELLSISDDPTTPMAMLRSVLLEAAVGDVSAFAVAPGGFYVATGNANLHLVDGSGHRVATWTGGALSSSTLPGVLDIVGRLVAHADGSVEVLSVGTHRIERFAPRE